MNPRQQAISKMNSWGSLARPFLFIIDYEMMKPIVLPLDEIDKSNIFYSLSNFQKLPAINLNKKEFVFRKYPIDHNDYSKAFVRVKEELKKGNTYLLNLTFPTRLETNLTFDEIFLLSKAKYKLLFGNEFVLFSPETFVQINEGKIFSFPMKGTIDAAIENAAEIILGDDKELAEHNTIVDLIRNDLSIVSKNVTVEKFRYIEKIETHDKQLLHVSSKISGELPENYKARVGDIIFSLLPAGSISGAPKKKTIEIIKEVEPTPRNYYTGIFGIFDGNNLDSAVMIRFIENVNGQLYFRSGGGITYQSDLESEYKELIDKVYVPINRSN